MNSFIKLKKVATKKLTKFYKLFNSLQHRDIYLFFFSFLLILGIKFIQFPSLTYNAEMFVENGTNFFIHAYKDGILTNLVTTDAGYLPLTQRIIAVTLVKLFHIVELYPYFSQLIAVAFIAGMSSLINLNFLKNLYPSFFLRNLFFFLSLGEGGGGGGVIRFPSDEGGL